MRGPTKRKSGLRGFYTALAISLLMIAAACVFAYRQTSETLEQNLNSLTEQMEVTEAVTTPYEAPVVEVKTDVPKETFAQTQTAIPKTTAAAETTAVQTQVSSEAPMHQLTLPLANFSILNPFSNGELVKSETTGTWQTHNGVDLSCAAGSDVFAIDSGTISEISSDALWGYTVTIDHGNGVTSRYCGMDGSLEVREGDTVQSGQKLGVTGANPDLESALEPHLHLEVKKAGAYIDPAAYFG